MKKTLLACLLVLGVCFGLYADSTEDTQFKRYVELTRNNKGNPKGMTICADNTYRIIYIATSIPANYADVTPQLQQTMRKTMLEAMAKPNMKADRKVVKNLKITFLYTFLTNDKKAFTIIISHKDL